MKHYVINFIVKMHKISENLLQCKLNEVIIYLEV